MAGGGRKTTGKPKGAMNSYACFVQKAREDHEKKRRGEKVVFTEFSKMCADRWNKMSSKEKGPFQQMAAEDKVRHQAEMINYLPPMQSNASGKGKRKRKEKDPNAPKKALSGFFWFCNDERAQIKAANPEFKIGDIAKVLGRMWAQVDEATKAKYATMSQRDKARYEREMESYTRGAAAATVDHDDDDDEDEEEEDY